MFLARRTGARFAGFLRSQDGMVTVEWVAIAGALFIGAITVGWLVMKGVETPANSISTTVTRCQQDAAKNGGSTSSCP